jgi:hypothetical protein
VALFRKAFSYCFFPAFTLAWVFLRGSRSPDDRPDTREPCR